MRRPAERESQFSICPGQKNLRRSVGIVMADNLSYSTERGLSLFEAFRFDIDLQVTRKALLRTRPPNPFESALLLSSLLRLPDIAKDRDVWPLVDQVVEDQSPGGNWSSRPMLRVTRRDCLEPWRPGDLRSTLLRLEPPVHRRDGDGCFLIVPSVDRTPFSRAD